MSTASAFPPVDLVKEWDTEQLIDFLRKQSLKMKETHFTILQEQEVTGLAFLRLNVDKLIAHPYNLPGGPAETIAELIDKIKGEDQVTGRYIEKKKQSNSMGFMINWIISSASDVYFDTMDKISCPSKWAKEWTKDSKQKDGILFRNHRPTNASDIPIQFYHQIFETFISSTQDCRISNRERKLVLELASVMSGIFSDESQRADAFRCWLELFFDDKIEIQSVESNEASQSSRIGERKTDGSIYPKIGRDRVLLANLEVKSEPGNGDCYIHNDAYYKEFVIKSRKRGSEFYNRTCLPAFLIDLD
ncbi:18694_t:CDS:2, partial [Gigaspora rosea]